jgi:4'-phosphopantetheinyl transferase
MQMVETELWLVDLHKSGEALEALEASSPRLSSDVLTRLAAIKDEATRRERMRAHIALRVLLERQLGPSVRGMPFVIGASGKPALANDGVSFSLAHTKGLALIGTGPGMPLGVDLELMRAVHMPETRRAPIEREAVALAAGAPLGDADADARFLRAWVRIEAVAKALGEGVGPLLEHLRPGREAPHSSAEHVSLPGAEQCRIVAHDVAATRDLFAAVALPAGQSPPPLGVLPEAAAKIEALLEPGSGTRR